MTAPSKIESVIKSVEEEIVKVVTVTQPASAAFQLDAHDLKGLARNILIVLVAYGVTYFSRNVMAVDIDSATMLIVPIVAGVIDAAIRLIKNNKQKDIK